MQYTKDEKRKKILMRVCLLNIAAILGAVETIMYEKLCGRFKNANWNQWEKTCSQYIPNESTAARYKSQSLLKKH